MGFARSASIGALVLLYACSGAATPGGDGQTPGAAGTPTTVVGISTVAPATLNPLTVEGASPATSYVMAAVLSGAYRVRGDLTYEPDLLVEDASVSEDPFAVTYRLRDDAVWSDGVPISSSDLAFTWRTILEPEFEAGATDGYDAITDAELIDEHTVRFTFDSPYPAFRELFPFVLPEHELEGTPPGEMWSEEVTLASGPFEVEHWEPGGPVALVRNERYWGQPASLEEVEVRFIEDVSTQLELLRAQEIDVLVPQPQSDIVRQLEEIPDVSWDAALDVSWEQVTFNLTQPPLDRVAVRRAIAHAVDRHAVLESVVDAIDEAAVLDSALLVTNHPGYVPHFARYDHDPRRARTLLDEAGCPLGDDRTRSCDGHPLTLRFGTTAGVPARELLFEILQAQLSEVGIELVPALEEPNVFFSTVQSGDWDLASFAWFGGADPAGNAEIFRCDGELNWSGYCNDDLDGLIARASTTADTAPRRDLFDRAGQIIAEDLPLLPLYQRPTFVAWRDRLEGPAPNPGPAGPLWNIEHWERRDPPDR